MADIDFLATNITERYGTVKRARDCFLYTAKGVRLTDLYLEGGRAILGWGSSGSIAYKIFKNVLSRGITGSFDTDYSPRAGGGKSQLSRAVSELLDSERDVFVFNTKERAFQAAESFGGAAEYRPWNPDGTDWASHRAVYLEPPLPWTPSFSILAVDSGAVASGTAPRADKQPAPLCAAATRAVYDLIKALQERQETDWFIYDPVVTKYWTRRGPYLYPTVPEARYNDFILHCLDCTLVISPEYGVPSIVPFGADKGNFSKLKNNPFTY